MRSSRLILLFVLLPLFASAQNGIITGRVVRGDVKTPLAKASVFLSNATFGTITAEDGSFTLNAVKPGQYLLVVSTVGFEEYSKTILVGRDPIKLNIELLPRVTELHEVVITTPADWKKNYEQFKREFIGTDENSKKCKVINPHVVTLIYHKTKQQLEAYTDEFLIVQNKALGYQVKFLIKAFTSDNIDHIISYQGQALFQELPGSAAEKKKWHLKREEAYYGSARHFYRSLYSNKLGSEGFVIRKFTRELNPNRPQEALIQQKFKRFKNNRDSLNYWITQSNMPKYYKENLVRQPLQVPDVLMRTEQQGIFAISFTDCMLYVVYTKKREEFDFKDLYRPLDMENFETSVVTLYKPYAFFDMNGTILADSPLYEGTWSKSKLSDMLPVDYAPDE